MHQKTPLKARLQAKRSQIGLDWVNFFIADVQTGFGPFVAVYLATQHWTQSDIGYVLALGGLASVVSQMPAGALVDAVSAKRWSRFYHRANRYRLYSLCRAVGAGEPWPQPTCPTNATPTAARNWPPRRREPR